MTGEVATLKTLLALAGEDSREPKGQLRMGEETLREALETMSRDALVEVLDRQWPYLRWTPRTSRMLARRAREVMDRGNREGLAWSDLTDAFCRWNAQESRGGAGGLQVDEDEVAERLARLRSALLGDEGAPVPPPVEQVGYLPARYVYGRFTEDVAPPSQLLGDAGPSGPLWAGLLQNEHLTIEERDELATMVLEAGGDWADWAKAWTTPGAKGENVRWFFDGLEEYLSLHPRAAEASTTKTMLERVSRLGEAWPSLGALVFRHPDIDPEHPAWRKAVGTALTSGGGEHRPMAYYLEAASGGRETLVRDFLNITAERSRKELGEKDGAKEARGPGREAKDVLLDAIQKALTTRRPSPPRSGMGHERARIDGATCPPPGPSASSDPQTSVVPTLLHGILDLFDWTGFVEAVGAQRALAIVGETRTGRSPLLPKDLEGPSRERLPRVREREQEGAHPRNQPVLALFFSHPSRREEHALRILTERFPGNLWAQVLRDARMRRSPSVQDRILASGKRSLILALARDYEARATVRAIERLWEMGKVEDVLRSLEAEGCPPTIRRRVLQSDVGNALLAMEDAEIRERTWTLVGQAGPARQR